MKKNLLVLLSVKKKNKKLIRFQSSVEIITFMLNY